MNTDIITVPKDEIEVLTAGKMADNPVTVYLSRLGNKRTRDVQRQALDTIAGLITGGAVVDCFLFLWQDLRYVHTQAIRAALAERYAAATCMRMLSALRGVLKAAFRMGLMAAEYYQLAIMIDAVIGQTVPAGRYVEMSEREKLTKVCEQDTSGAGARDAAILAIFNGCGVRRAELAGLQLADFDTNRGELLIRGKRNKERIVYITNGARLAVNDWLEVRRDKPGAFFCAINKAGRLGGGMTAQAIYSILRERGAAAGLAKFSPHDLRRTYASDLLDAGADISIVSKLMGHSSVNTTGKYDRRPETAKREASELLHVPYHGRG